MSKGGAFENFVGRILSDWGTEGKDLHQFTRTDLSGGHLKARKSPEGYRQVGDLTGNGTFGDEFRRYFAIEAKHRAICDWWHFFTKKPGPDNLQGWWHKILLEVEAVDPVPAPLLVIRKNNRPVMVGLPEAVVPRVFLPNSTKMMIFLPERIAVMEFTDFTVLRPEVYYHGVEHWRRMRVVE